MLMSLSDYYTPMSVCYINFMSIKCPEDKALFNSVVRKD